MLAWRPERRTIAVRLRAAARLLQASSWLLFFCWIPAAVCGPIHSAASKGDVARTAALLKSNPKVVAERDKLGNTPLHLAAKHNQPAVAELLVANGADVNAVNAQGETPLTYAIQSFHHKETMELLLTHGADVNQADRNLDTPLQYAIQLGLVYDVQLLLANGADPNTGGGAPLRAALRSDQFQDRVPVVKMLLDYGADPNAKDWEGYRLMHYADDQKVIDLLRAYGGHL